MHNENQMDGGCIVYIPRIYVNYGTIFWQIERRRLTHFQWATARSSDTDIYVTGDNKFVSFC